MCHHEEVTVDVAASPERLFEYLDDPTRLGGHMTKPSGMMLGGSMSYEVDERGGREVGSVIRMTGAILGLRLGVRRDRDRAHSASTQGVGDARTAADDRDRLLSQSGLLRHLSLPLAKAYARWCVQRMADDVPEHFGTARATTI